MHPALDFSEGSATLQWIGTFWNIGKLSVAATWCSNTTALSSVALFILCVREKLSWFGLWGLLMAYNCCLHRAAFGALVGLTVRTECLVPCARKSRQLVECAGLSHRSFAAGGAGSMQQIRSRLAGHPVLEG